MLDIVIEARKASLAQGIDVKSILPFRLRRMVGPFIFQAALQRPLVRPWIVPSDAQ